MLALMSSCMGEAVIRSMRGSGALPDGVTTPSLADVPQDILVLELLFHVQVGAFMEAYAAEVDFLVNLLLMFHVTKRRFIVSTFVPYVICIWMVLLFLFVYKCPRLRTFASFMSQCTFSEMMRNDSLVTLRGENGQKDPLLEVGGHRKRTSKSGNKRPML